MNDLFLTAADPYGYATLVFIAWLIIVSLVMVGLWIIDYCNAIDKGIREIPDAIRDQEEQDHD